MGDVMTPEEILKQALKAKEDMDFEMQREKMLAQFPPNSWVENGVRKVTVWEDDSEYEFVKEGDSFTLRPRIPF